MSLLCNATCCADVATLAALSPLEGNRVIARVCTSSSLLATANPLQGRELHNALRCDIPTTPRPCSVFPLVASSVVGESGIVQHPHAQRLARYRHLGKRADVVARLNPPRRPALWPQLRPMYKLELGHTMM